MSRKSPNGSYYSEVFYVPGTNHEVAIYKIASSKRDNWYARIIRRTNKGGYYRRTLRTDSKDIAMSKAVREWVRVRKKEEIGINPQRRSRFEPLVREWIQSRLDNGYSEQATKTIEYQFNNHFIPYFGQMDMDSINERAYIEYLNNYRLNPDKYKNMRKKPTIRSLSTEQSNLRAFLRWCVTRGYRTQPVVMRNVAKNQLDMVWNHQKIHMHPDQRRDLVSTEVYATYRQFLRNGPGKGSREARNVLIARRRMHFYLITIYNFVCRAGKEVLNLRFRDLEVVMSNIQSGSAYVRMTTHHGKKVNRPGYGPTSSLIYHSDYHYPGLLLTWIDFLQTGGGWIPNDPMRNPWIPFPTGPDDYVFPHRKRDGTINPMNSVATTRYMEKLRPQVIRWSQRKNKNHSDKLEDEIYAFTPYSVRHIAIRNLIVEGEQSFSNVAERANTSTSMIESFYYKYGLKPEGRLVSKHPTPEPRNTKYYSEEEIEALKARFKTSRG